MNRKDFKNLLTEWNASFNNNMLTETKAGKKYIEKVKAAINPDNYDKLYNLNPTAATDTLFLKIVVKTFEEEQGHSIEDIERQYEDFLKYVKKNWERGKSASVDVPGGLRTELLPDNTTYDDLVSFCEAKKSMMLKSKAFIECLAQEDINPDFEVIINDSDWIICYPKTIRGSISLARSYWNGERLEYDTTISGGIGQNIGRMGWCTSIVSNGNMFLNYHRKANLHMYYCIKKNMSVEDLDRKLCISFQKQNGDVYFIEGNASVNGNNTSTNRSKFREYIGSRFDVLIEDVEKDTRPELNEKAYYESINVDQYRILRAANEDNLELFIQELKEILKYSRDRSEIFSLIVEKENESFKSAVFKSIYKFEDLLEIDPEGVVIKQLAQDPDENVRIFIASHNDLLAADPSGNVIKQLAQDPELNVKRKIALREDLLEADPSGESINILINDPEERVSSIVVSCLHLNKYKTNSLHLKQLAQVRSHIIREYVAKHNDLLAADPSGNVIKQLAQDEHEDVRNAIAARKDFSELYYALLALKPSINLIEILCQNEETIDFLTNEYNLKDKNRDKIYIIFLCFMLNSGMNINTLEKHKIIRYDNLLEADPTGNAIRKLAQDEDSMCREKVARRKDLLEVDPTGATISLLVQDESHYVRRILARNENLLKIDPSGEIIRQLAQDEISLVRNEIANRKDLLKLDPSGEIIKQLSKDALVDIRRTISKREDLLVADPSGEIIRQLAQDRDAYVKSSIAKRKDLLKLDPSGYIIRRLAYDEHTLVKSEIASNLDLLKADPSGYIIKKLSQDSVSDIRRSMACRKDLLEADPSGETIRRLAQDPDEDIREIIADRKDLLEADPSGEIIRKLAQDVSADVRYYLGSNYDLDNLPTPKRTDESTLKEYIRLIIS